MNVAIKIGRQAICIPFELRGKEHATCLQSSLVAAPAIIINSSDACVFVFLVLFVLSKCFISVPQAAEAEEEAIVNRMVIRLEEIKKEKESLALQVEREEEMITSTLQRKLSLVGN